jgi:aldehyde:ferredoxin oxidoreductase
MARAVDPLAEDGHGKGEMISSSQKGQAIDDSAIVCNFGSMGLTPELRNQLLAAATGIDEFGDPNKLEKMGERIVCLERAFNVREGFSRKDDTLPDRFLTEPLRDAGPATGQIVRNLDGLIDEFYDVAGYTRQGIPTPRKLQELGLSDVAKDIQQFTE